MDNEVESVEDLERFSTEHVASELNDHAKHFHTPYYKGISYGCYIITLTLFITCVDQSATVKTKNTAKL